MVQRDTNLRGPALFTVNLSKFHTTYIQENTHLFNIADKVISNRFGCIYLPQILAASQS